MQKGYTDLIMGTWWQGSASISLMPYDTMRSIVNSFAMLNRMAIMAMLSVIANSLGAIRFDLNGPFLSTLYFCPLCQSTWWATKKMGIQMGRDGQDKLLRNRKE
jgi:hypothetical protein